MTTATAQPIPYLRATYSKYRSGGVLSKKELEDLRDHFRVLKDHLIPFIDMDIVLRAVYADFLKLSSEVDGRESRHLKSV